MVKFPVISPLKKTESIPTYTAAKRPQLWKTTLQRLIIIFKSSHQWFSIQTVTFEGREGEEWE